MKGRSIKNSQPKTKSQAVVGGLLNTNSKEAIAEPPVPPLGVILQAHLESPVPGIGAGGNAVLLGEADNILRTEPFPSLPTSSGFLQEMETFKMDADKALGYMAAV